MKVVHRNELWCEETNAEKGAEIDVIYYQQKGYADSLYYKTFLWTSGGDYFEGTGNSVEQAVDCVKGWRGAMPAYKGILYE